MPILVVMHFRDQNKKKEAIATLRKRALNKNPDEFQYHMINSELKVKNAAFVLIGITCYIESSET